MYFNTCENTFLTLILYSNSRFLFTEQPIPSDPSEHEIEDFSSPVFSLGPFNHNGCGTYFFWFFIKLLKHTRKEQPQKCLFKELC